MQARLGVNERAIKVEKERTFAAGVTFENRLSRWGLCQCASRHRGDGWWSSS